MQSSDIYNFLLDLLIMFIILHLVVNIYLFIC